MCGIAGYVTFNAGESDGARLLRMVDAIAHRGPDDAGYALIRTTSGEHLDLVSHDSDPRLKAMLPDIAGTAYAHDVAFGHRRYSVVDLSPGGHQPMWSACGNACLCFNGEIYNYLELRDELVALGHRFVTTSDTEVFLAGYIAWGTEVFRRLNGPFAAAIYDRRKRAVLLARDRLGKSPLYLCSNGGAIQWASEIKALLATGGVARADVNQEVVNEFLAYGWRDRGRTFWNGVEDFPPASYLWLTASCNVVAAQRYWRLPDARRTAAELPFAQAREQFTGLLSDALALRLRSDVKVGFELSGGLDSSSLVAVAAGTLQQDITTYTIQFDEPGSNEEPFARAVHARYPDRIDYRVIRPGAEDFWADADRFVWVEEEPFHSPNLHTNHRLRRQIRDDGRGVVITGAAGDEVLAGYATDYLRPYLAALLRQGRLGRFAREATHNSEVGPLSAMVMLAQAQAARLGIGKVDRSRHWHWLRQLTGANARPFIETGTFDAVYAGNLAQRKMNYWLRSGNKANFSIPIESRSPFLDPSLVDFCAALPPEYLISGGWQKFILREAMAGLLPDDVRLRRVKMGFPFPLAQWLLASEAIVRRNLGDLDVPCFDAGRFLDHYAAICAASPAFAWRVVSVGLWWRRVVCDRPIVA
jgi:asparagine synthase (glutamine-hydrolysing)